MVVPTSDPKRIYHFPGKKWAATTETTAATIQGRISAFPFQTPINRQRKTAVKAKSKPHCVGSVIPSPSNLPNVVEPTHATNRTRPLPRRKAISRLPLANSFIVSAQFSSARKKSVIYFLRGGRSASHLLTVIPKRTLRRFTSKVVKMIAPKANGTPQRLRT